MTADFLVLVSECVHAQTIVIDVTISCHILKHGYDYGNVFLPCSNTNNSLTSIHQSDYQRSTQKKKNIKLE